MKRWTKILSLLAVLLISMAATAADFEVQVLRLIEAGFPEKARLVGDIAQSGDERALDILNAWNDGELYFVRNPDRVVFAESSDSGFTVTDVLTGDITEGVGRRAVRPISVNNSLRQTLGVTLGALRLSTGTDAQRLEAARRLLRAADRENRALIETALETETHEPVRRVLLHNIALLDFNYGTVPVQLAALNTLQDSLNSDVRNALTRKLAAAETDPQVRAEVEQVLEKIEGRVRFFRQMDNVFFGLSLGSVLLLAAIGLAITFGVMGVINMAHGEMMMLGAYTTFVVQKFLPVSLDYSLLVAVPLAFLVAGAVGVLMERGIIRFLYGRPLETLLATFGISLILQQTVRSIFGPLNQAVANPSWMSGSWVINGAFSITYNRLFIVIFAIMVFLSLLFVLRHTRFGLQMRAVTQNRAMANSMGIRSGWVDALTFGLGSGVAGIAGVALSQLTNVGPNLGQAYIIDSFLVVVFGGVGNLWGTLVAALSLGVANKLIEPYTGAVLAKIVLLIGVILFIQKRPRGLFALKGRAVEG
ncbi:MAG: urea ABC transporter permease subunit UrtB [Natronospirillum sp.]